ncbi:L-histidine N(alpha)-methyltransferase [Millisia brevis]|uniref:L-histidine N(alpha)-methyltransferase n=1 Tax=Millisia brevis TaxID=264148 RepID=UPI0008346FBF|nr:L-histidine N(alpha)-methyltransferase [Millisia brevis]
MSGSTVVTPPDPSPLAGDALAGLWLDPPALPAKWLYDERGSRLFDEITQLPEYYPTRRETYLLTRHAADIARSTDATMLIEFGSGTSTKTRILLDALTGVGDGRTLAYVPVDVSSEMLTSSAQRLALDYPDLDVRPVVADFTDPDLRLPAADGARLAVLLGGTIGNFDQPQRRAFFTGLAGALQPGDFVLIGADLIKDTGRLVAAYNDKAGVTADFNRNVIEVLRRELDASGLYPDDFDHIARWNPADHRIEMWLRARRDVHAHFGALAKDWQLPAGAEILTEISIKFDAVSLSGELSDAGLDPVTEWTDPSRDFALLLARVR